MKTPICDFVEQYRKKEGIRLHMPGHKGKNILGCEAMDITEIDGADYLYHSDGIIAESEDNASSLFGSKTFYSAEGSSLAIRAMLFLAMTRSGDKNPILLAARNVHKTFITAAALLDFDVEWLYSKESKSYHSCIITKEDVAEALGNMSHKPFAVYLTSPDYLGNIADIKGIAEVCKSYGVPLLVDNAHGAYLRFLEPSQHPIDLGATMCADSAHKTLPALTGAAYLHIAREEEYFIAHAKEALSLFGSTSPSYLVLESLDQVNLYLTENKGKYSEFQCFIQEIKDKLISFGYTLVGNEPMKISIDAREYGYTGDEMNEYLANRNISVEFHDEDYIVLMPSLSHSMEELNFVASILMDLKKKESIKKECFPFQKRHQELSIRKATLSLRERVSVLEAKGRILADTAVTCPPAVPIVISGERMDDVAVKMFEYYGIFECSVVKNS